MLLSWSKWLMVYSASCSTISDPSRVMVQPGRHVQAVDMPRSRLCWSSIVASPTL